MHIQVASTQHYSDAVTVLFSPHSQRGFPSDSTGAGRHVAENSQLLLQAQEVFHAIRRGDSVVVVCLIDSHQQIAGAALAQEAHQGPRKEDDTLRSAQEFALLALYLQVVS